MIRTVGEMHEVRLEFRARFCTREEAVRTERVIRDAVRDARASLSWQLSTVPTLREAAPSFLRYQRVFRRNGPRTLADHQRALDYWIGALARHGEAALDRILPADVEAGVESLLDIGREPSTVNKTLKSLRQLGAWALGPGRLVPPGTQLAWMHIPPVRAKAKPPRWLPREGLVRVLRRWPEGGRHVALVIWAMILSGCRPEALLSLRWRDVRPPRPASVGGAGASGTDGWLRVRPLKGGRTVSVRLSAGSALEAVIDEARRVFTEFRDRAPRGDDYVFVPRWGRAKAERWSSPGFAQAVRYHADRARAGEDGAAFVAYVSRHSALTELALAGVGADHRRNYAGHASEAMQRVYVHTSGEDAAQVREVVDGLFGAACRGWIGVPDSDDGDCSGLSLQPIAV